MMTKQKSGASIIWAIIISAVLLIVSTTMSTFIIKESQMGVRMDDSARAYAAAQSGVDWAKACLAAGSSCKDSVDALIQPPPTGSGGVYTKNFSIKNDDISSMTTYYIKIELLGSNYDIHSRGTSNSVNREIEYTYQTLNSGTFGYLPTDNSVTTGPINMVDSYTLSFTYWNAANVFLPAGTLFGLKDDQGHFLGVKLNGSPSSETDGTIDLAACKTDCSVAGNYFSQNAPTNSTYNSPISLINSLVNPSFNFYQSVENVTVTLDYADRRSLRLTVTGVDGNNKKICLGTKTWFIDASYKLHTGTGTTKILYSSDSGTSWSSPTGGQNSTFSDAGVQDTGEYFYKIGNATNYAYLSGFYGFGIKPTDYETISYTSANGSLYFTVGGQSVGNSVPQNTVVTITASPNTFYAFQQWGGDCSGTSNTCTLTMDTNKNVTAVYISTLAWLSSSNSAITFKVANANADMKIWGPNGEDCSTANHTNLGHDCTLVGSYYGLVSSGGAVRYSLYPAQKACIAIGGRLPTAAELLLIAQNHDTFGAGNDNFGTGLYWSSEQASVAAARVVNFGVKVITTATKYTSMKVRCVK